MTKYDADAIIGCEFFKQDTHTLVHLYT